ncbi:MAG: RcpC/CpaB family pilus assembly protein [Chloroflexota bacterium]|nr:RcpC/CpaB family pilus assembly protein [Chloroflexota bacterium]
MRLSLKRLKPAGPLDLLTPALLSGGVALIVVSIVAGKMLLAPPALVESGAADPNAAAPAATAVSRPPAGLSADQVATLLSVDASSGGGLAARSGDRVDVFGYFSRQVIGSESVTRVLLQDAPVLTVDRSGPTVVLSLAVPHDGALLLQEAQAIGARPFVTLRGVAGMPSPDGTPRTFSDTDLANRLAGVR